MRLSRPLASQCSCPPVAVLQDCATSPSLGDAKIWTRDHNTCSLALNPLSYHISLWATTSPFLHACQFCLVCLIKLSLCTSMTTCTISFFFSDFTKSRWYSHKGLLILWFSESCWVWKYFANFFNRLPAAFGYLLIWAIASFEGVCSILLPHLCLWYKLLWDILHEIYFYGSILLPRVYYYCSIAAIIIALCFPNWIEMKTELALFSIPIHPSLLKFTRPLYLLIIPSDPIIIHLEGTVQRDLRWVKSGINQ